jgi:hypothetical protein
MKKLCGLLLLCILGNVFPGFGQNIPSYPIPSYNVPVIGTVNFSNGTIQTDSCNLTDEKRDVNIHLQSASIEDPGCGAEIWVYSLDQTTILGPYEMICGETLVVQVDEREWGVLVESEQMVTVDVWF